MWGDVDDTFFVLVSERLAMSRSESVDEDDVACGTTHGGERTGGGGVYDEEGAGVVIGIEGDIGTGYGGMMYLWRCGERWFFDGHV